MNIRLLAPICFSALLLQADTLVMRDGTRFDGRFLGGDDHVVRFDNGSGPKTYSLDTVDSVRFSPAPQAYAPPPSSPPVPIAPPPAPTDSAPVYNPAPGPSAPVNTGGIEIPSGTLINVRLIDGVNSETDRLGQTYRASLDEPVVVNGQTVIPRGADAVATLIRSQQSGKIEGRTELTLDLKSVTVNGRSYDITTTGVSQVSNSRGERSAKVIGGTAAVGAIIGALAGGGRGAAIGAGSGAAAGTAAQVITSGQKVKIPSETRLTFTLQNPVTL